MALSFLMVFGQQGCTSIDPAQKQKPIIDKDTNTDAFEGQHRIVLEWIKAEGYRLTKKDNFYTLWLNPSILLNSNAAMAVQVDDPKSWTQVTVGDVILTVRHNHFVIQTKDVGKAAFTLDENEKLQPYDIINKEK